MEVHLFGTEKCGKCQSTKHKVEHLVRKFGLQGKVRLAFFDMETVDGRAEGAFYEVHAIPTTIIRQNGRDVARWEGEVPDSAELKGLFIGKA